MLMLRRAGGSASGDGLSDAAGAAMLPHAPSYAPSKSQRWLCCAVGGLVALSLAARAAAGGLRRRARNVVPCAVSTAADYGRAPPGAVLSDGGGCAKASSLDSGVCVQGTDGRRPSVRCVPTVAVIGAMKSGTTNIMLYLQQHPRLRTSENRWGWPVESRFFASAPSAADAVGTWRDYLAIYPAVDASSAPGDRVRTFDKSPNYLPNAIVPSILAAIAPSLRIVVTLRDPTARAYSHFQHECRNGRIFRDRRGAVTRSSCGLKRAPCPSPRPLPYPCAPADFHAAVSTALRDHAPPANATGAPGDGDWRCAWSLGADGRGDSNVLPRGFYDCQLSRWLKEFPRDQLLALVFEEFLASRDATLAAVARVEAAAGVAPFGYAASKKVALIERLYAAVPSRGAKYAPMRPDTKEALDALYCDPNRRLAHTLGRTLPWPCGGAS